MYLGIDTSNYRTSAALISSDGQVAAQKAILLDVPEGKRGLRQSEAFFLHSNRLPQDYYTGAYAYHEERRHPHKLRPLQLRS